MLSDGRAVKLSRTPPGVRELKRGLFPYEDSCLSRTPPGVRELKRRSRQRST